MLVVAGKNMTQAGVETRQPAAAYCIVATIAASMLQLNGVFDKRDRLEEFKLEQMICARGGNVGDANQAQHF